MNANSRSMRLVWLTLMFLPLSAFAAPDTKKKAAPRPPAASAPGAVASSPVLWDAWYRITVGNGRKFGYYNERTELLPDKRVIVKVRMWKKDEGFIDEEQTGTVASDTPDLTPIFYNFRKVSKTLETKVDGSVESGGILNLKIHQAGKELPQVRRTVPKQSFFSNMFAYWLAKRSRNLSGTVPFNTIVEDQFETNVFTASGSIAKSAPDDFARKTHTTKVAVTHAGQKSTWYLDESGVAVRIDLTSQNATVERVPESEAKGF